ncbi:MAG: hypothetical protein HY902_17930, partial [Deltaproteobacteria bacterium]|nr:hypothetical protein [Deltaproteobacteria bacterium]
GTESNDLWAAGDQGTLLHWDGTAWTKVDSTVPAGHLYQPWGAGPNDIWVPANMGVLLHYNGVKWQQFDWGGDDNLRAIWGSSGKDIWMVGPFKAVAHYQAP